jgi:hypothetical protein
VTDHTAAENINPLQDGLTGEQVDFLGKVLGANAAWSAGIHEAALDGQERQAAEWAQRYVALHWQLRHVLGKVPAYERETELFTALADVVDDTVWWAEHAGDAVAHHFERTQRRKAERAERAATAAAPVGTES